MILRFLPLGPQVMVIDNKENAGEVSSGLTLLGVFLNRQSYISCPSSHWKELRRPQISPRSQNEGQDSLSLTCSPRSLGLLVFRRKQVIAEVNGFCDLLSDVDDENKYCESPRNIKHILNGCLPPPNLRKELCSLEFLTTKSKKSQAQTS
jgi:hypothetical protein